MKKFSAFIFGLVVSAFLLTVFSPAYAQAPGSTSVPAGQPQVYNYNVTSAAPVIVVPAGGNISWSIFAESADIRCVPIIPGTNNPPTASYGWLAKGAGIPITSWPYTDPTIAWECIATGTSTVVSVEIDARY